MANTIKQARGLKANMPTLEAGQIYFCTDTKETYIGDGTTNYLIWKGAQTPWLSDIDADGHSLSDLLSLATDEVKARDADGLKLTDDAGNGIFVEDGGNVGIGTTSPDTTLHLAKSTGTELRLETSGASDPTLSFKTTNTAHQVNLFLDESESFDLLALAGQTAEVGTAFQIQALSGEYASLYLKGGSTGSHKAYLYLSPTDNYVIHNPIQDKDIIFYINDGGTTRESLRIDGATSNIGIGTASPGGGTTAGEHVLSLKDVTNVPAGGVSGQVSLYSSGGELYAFDSAGNATLLSPHKFELFEPDPSYELPFSYYSENRFIGKKINVDMYGAIKALEELTGKRFIYVEDLPAEETISWDENEERLQAKRKEEIKEWKKRKAKYDKALAEHEALPEEEREKVTPPEPPGEKPKPYVKRSPPGWMAPRLRKPLRKGGTK